MFKWCKHSIIYINETGQLGAHFSNWESKFDFKFTADKSDEQPHRLQMAYNDVDSVIYQVLARSLMKLHYRHKSLNLYTSNF